jgi:hypothetical protein
VPRRNLPTWFPLYGVALLAATMSPLWRTCRVHGIESEFYWLDFGLNVLLFVPLGHALLALLLSLALETTQSVLPRDPNGFDCLANVFGAWLGMRLEPGFLRMRRHAPVRALGVTALLIAWAVVITLSVQRLPNDFSNWRPYDLVIGTPADASARWQGTIAEFALFDRANAKPLAGAAAPPLWRDGGPILWLRFASPPRGRIDGPDGPRPLNIAPEPLSREGWAVEGRSWVLPKPLAQAVHARLSDTSEFAIDARLRSVSMPSALQTPIVSLSRDPVRHSFTLEQHGRELDLRVHTPSDAAIPWQAELRTEAGALTGDLQWVRAEFHGPIARMFVDGECRGEVLYPLVYQPWPLAAGIVPAILLCTVGSALALAGLPPLRTRRARAVVFWAAGSGAWLLLWAVGAWSHFPDYDAVAGCLTAFGLAAAAPILGVPRLEAALSDPPSAHPG